MGAGILRVRTAYFFRSYGHGQRASAAVKLPVIVVRHYCWKPSAKSLNHYSRRFTNRGRPSVRFGTQWNTTCITRSDFSARNRQNNNGRYRYAYVYNENDFRLQESNEIRVFKRRRRGRAGQERRPCWIRTIASTLRSDGRDGCLFTF